jgi:hypothetical protein
MRFLLDMGISPRTGEHLKARGHEALHLREVALERMADPDILAKARREVDAVRACASRSYGWSDGNRSSLRGGSTSGARSKSDCR